MKNIIKKGLFLFVLLFAFMFKINAASFGISASKTSVQPNEQVTFTISVPQTLGSLTLKFNYDSSKFNYTSSSDLSGIMSISSPGTGVVTANFSNPSGFSGNIFKVTLTSKGSATSGSSSVSVSTDDCYDVNVNEVSISSASVSITHKVLNNDTSLKSLTVDGSNILSSKSYTTDKASVSVTASKNVSSQSISGDGYKNLKCGNNSFTITVTAEAGNKSDYVINIKRTCSSDASLKELVVDNGKINFSPSTYSYSVELPADVGSLTATATVNDSLTTIDQRIKTVKVDKGKSSNIIFNLTAQDGTKKTYTIKVTRIDDRSSDNTLKTLEVLDSNANNLITFGSKTTYNLTVLFDINEVNVKAVANDSKASIKGKVGKQSLNVGNNKLTVTVTAENGTTKNYIININRKDVSGNVEETEDVDILSSLTVEGFDIEFNPEQYEYKIEIDKDITELNIVAVPSDSNKTIQIDGNGDFEIGKEKEVNINIVDSEGTVLNTYTIRAIIPEEEEENEEVVTPPVVKNDDKKDNNLILYIGIGVGLLVLIIIIVIILKKKKNNTNDSINNVSTPVSNIPSLESHNDNVVEFSNKLDLIQEVAINEVKPVVQVEPQVVEPIAQPVVETPVVEPVSKPVVEPVVNVAPVVETPVVEQPVTNIFPEIENVQPVKKNIDIELPKEK